MTKEKLQEQLESLQCAIAEGALEIEFQGKKIRYRSLDEMRRIENSLKRQILSSTQVFQKIIPVFEKF